MAADLLASLEPDVVTWRVEERVPRTRR